MFAEHSRGPVGFHETCASCFLVFGLLAQQASLSPVTRSKLQAWRQFLSRHPDRLNSSPFSSIVEVRLFKSPMPFFLWGEVSNISNHNCVTTCKLFIQYCELGETCPWTRKFPATINIPRIVLSTIFLPNIVVFVWSDTFHFLEWVPRKDLSHGAETPRST